MKNLLTLLLLACLLQNTDAFAAPGQGRGQGQGMPPNGGYNAPPYLPPDLPDMDNLYFGNRKDIVLTPQEIQALKLSEKFQNNGGRPVQGPDGSIRFLYGAYQPSIICAVWQVTDIQLQPGEVINSLHIGDQNRWLLEPAVTGTTDGQEVQHIIVKPMDSDLETTLIATTNRRTYHLRLRSHKTRYMPLVSFIYPDTVMQRWEAANTRKREEIKQKVIPETGGYMDNLDFNYDISGSASWKPIRVYNDGIKTIIQMDPKKMREAPTLLIMRGSEQVMANYRLQDNRYVVDDVLIAPS